MKKITSLVLAGVAAVALSTSAQAADKNFNGFYAGAELGYNNFKLIDNKSGLYYGALAGYRVQMDNDLVVGLETRFGDTTANQTITVSTVDIDISAGRQIGVDALIGIAMGDDKDVLAFGTVGYTNARINGSAADQNASANGDGVRFAIGAEYLLTEKASLRVSGAYADYEGSARDWQLTTAVIFNF